MRPTLRKLIGGQYEEFRYRIEKSLQRTSVYYIERKIRHCGTI